MRFFIKNDEDGNVVSKTSSTDPDYVPEGYIETDAQEYNAIPFAIPPPKNYKGRRASEYPPLVDQLDALWKGGSEMEQMRKKILDIKKKYPKE